MISADLVASSGSVLDGSALIVEAIQRHTKVRAVVLCGSRATGRARADSDYDILAIVPLLTVPFRLRRLRLAARDLEAALGTHVSINPLPSFRLHHPGRTLLVWKALTEGTVLVGEPPPPAGIPTLEPAAARSYALSGIRYLIEHLGPGDVNAGPLPDRVTWDVQKALLHAAQLRLLQHGHYASTIACAITRLDRAGSAEFERLSSTPDRLETWRRTAQLLTPWLGANDAPSRSRPADLQYLALSLVNGGRLHPTVLLGASSIRVRLANAAEMLAKSVDASGHIDAIYVDAAAASLPTFLRPAEPSFKAVRAAIEREWPLADPLVGI